MDRPDRARNNELAMEFLPRPPAMAIEPANPQAHRVPVGPTSVENSMRPSGRASDVMRPVSLEPGVAKYAEGSCLAKFGDTHVLCTASVEERVPPFLRNTGKGWVTAEYGMLPRSTTTRTDPEPARVRPSGRTQEIHRLIARLLRQLTDLTQLGD